MSKFYITTPIYYINGLPHVGTAYCTIAADVVARYHRQQGNEVMFSAGTDENGQKILQAAEQAKKKPSVYVDEVAEKWKTTWAQLGISYDRFIRTTEPRHKKAVYDIIAKVQAKGDIYKGIYEGLYCVGHEAFLRPDELVDGKCPEHNTVPEKVKEENYFFKLKKYQQPLLDHIAKHPEFIQPATRRNEIVAFLKRGLEDLSISRKRANWGIPWPEDSSQAVYVWFDALVNYLTVVDYPDADYTKWWPADVHLVGKDISRFHCIYWPAMLMSAGIELPKQVFVHGFFTIDGQKISKSLGNAIDPVELAGSYGVDALRFYLLREISFGGDGEFSRERFHQVYNTELANELGNAVQRVSTMVTRYLGGRLGVLPKASHDVGLYHEAMNGLRLDRALDELWVHVKGVNQY
ncbi:MAG TPA: methionine--tRNA ligase, partial [Candidatus Saccharimonadales bacterium]|nr:methionine--tRNA ligase [Candidatus Saccharimonadales bacterium]